MSDTKLKQNVLKQNVFYDIFHEKLNNIAKYLIFIELKVIVCLGDKNILMLD